MTDTERLAEISKLQDAISASEIEIAQANRLINHCRLMITQVLYNPANYERLLKEAKE